MSTRTKAEIIQSRREYGLMPCPVCNEEWDVKGSIRGLNGETYCSAECSLKVNQPPYCHTYDGKPIDIGTVVYELDEKYREDGRLEMEEGIVTGYSNGWGGVVSVPTNLQYPHVHLNNEKVWPHGTSNLCLSSTKEDAIKRYKDGLKTCLKSRISDTKNNKAKHLKAIKKIRGKIEDEKNNLANYRVENKRQVEEIKQLEQDMS